MVKKFKISFLWVKTILEIFDYDENKSGKYIYRDYHSFEETLRKLSSDGTADRDYTYPWHELGHNNFWKHYLKCFNEKSLNISNLWDCIMPLYYKMKANIEFFSDGYGVMKVTGEPYLYHHGIGIAINIHIPSCEAGYSFGQIEEITRELYSLNKYKVRIEGSEFLTECNLDTLAKKLLYMLVKDVIGTDLPVDFSNKPFTVMTIFEGERFEITGTQLLDGVKKIFNALDQSFKEVIPISGYQDSEDIFCKNLVFTSKKGRMIWCPKSFLIPGGSNKSLGCYHKNIVRLTMQIESLSDLLKDFICLNRSYPYLDTYIGNAQHQLVKMYNPVNPNLRTTYCSASAVAQINQNDYLGLINMVREALKISRKVEGVQTKDIALRYSSSEPSEYL
jgi:hypothetical protein